MSGTGGWQHSGQVGDCRFEFSGVSVQRDGVPFAAAHANIASHEANHPPILPAGNGFGLAIPRAQRVRAHANNGPIRDTAACVDKPGSCSQASRTSRAARSFNSAGNFLPSRITPPCRGIRASIKLRAIHLASTAPSFLEAEARPSPCVFPQSGAVFWSTGSC